MRDPQKPKGLKMLGILSQIIGTAMSKQNSETGRISANEYANNAKSIAQLIRGA